MYFLPLNWFNLFFMIKMWNLKPIFKCDQIASNAPLVSLKTETSTKEMCNDLKSVETVHVSCSTPSNKLILENLKSVVASKPPPLFASQLIKTTTAISRVFSPHTIGTQTQIHGYHSVGLSFVLYPNVYQVQCGRQCSTQAIYSSAQLSTVHTLLPLGQYDICVLYLSFFNNSFSLVVFLCLSRSFYPFSLHT